MSKTLYRKYRPQTFREMIGQEHIKITLQNEIESDKIAHAYLFSGPRGIGKTTMARILAKAINCEKRKGFEPCNKCDSCKSITIGNCLDLIEIDAASNRGINEIRELRERVRYSPSKNKYKVFIIDEVHMLTIEAFNALLKILEEPPKHAIFILATTEFHKLPLTIISRCQRFDFKVVDVERLATHLKDICDMEKIKVNDKIIEQIARRSEGYVRDALSTLGQILSLSENNKVDDDTASLVLPKSDLQLIVSLIDNIIYQKFDLVIKDLDSLISEGIDLQYFTEELIHYLRKVLLVKISGASERYFWDIERNIEEKIIEQAKKLDLNTWHGILKEFYLVFDHLENDKFKQLPLEMTIISIKNKFFSKEKDSKFNLKSMKKENKSQAKVDENKLNNQKSSSNITVDDVLKIWAQLLINLKDYNHSLSAFVKVGHPLRIEDDELVIGFKFQFHLDRVSQNKNKKAIEDILINLLDKKLRISCEIDNNYEDNHKKIASFIYKDKDNKNVVDDVIKNFGGKVVE